MFFFKNKSDSVTFNIIPISFSYNIFLSLSHQSKKLTYAKTNVLKVHLSKVSTYVCNISVLPKLLERIVSHTIPITVRRIWKFLVGEFLKSTRHRYVPSSSSCTELRVSEAGRAMVAKYARGPKAPGSDHWSALLKERPRTSKL